MTDALDALRCSVDRLAGVVGTLDPARLTQPAYPTEWTVADTLSHMGSGAVIFVRLIDDFLAGVETPGDAFPAVWDGWNAKSPTGSGPTRSSPTGRCSTDSRASAPTSGAVPYHPRTDGHRLRHPGRTAAQRARPPHVGRRGGIRPVRHHRAGGHGIGDRRARQHAAGFTARPTGAVRTVHLVTTDPRRGVTIVLGADAVTFAYADPVDGPDLVLPAEACIRLVYGRLDPGHAGGAGESPVLDELRRVFPVCRRVCRRLSPAPVGRWPGSRRCCRQPPAGARSRPAARAARSSSPGRGRSRSARRPLDLADLLDALGQGDQAEGVAELDQGVDECGGVGGPAHLGHEGPVDLEDVDRELPQVGQRRVARCRSRRWRSARPSSFRRVRRSTVAWASFISTVSVISMTSVVGVEPVGRRGRRSTSCDERVRLELAHRDVDRHGQAAARAARQRASWRAGLVEHPAADVDDLAAVLEHRDEPVRGDEPLGGVVPPDQRLDALDPEVGRGRRSAGRGGANCPAARPASSSVRRARRSLAASVHGLLEDDGLVAAGALGPVERDVGVAQQVLGRACGRPRRSRRWPTR